MQNFEDLFRRFGRKYAAGETIYVEGDSADRVFVVNTGVVRESRSLLGMEKLLREMGPGEFFGETALITSSSRNSIARALSDSRILAIPGSIFQTMMRANIEIAVRLVRKLARHLDQLQKELGHLIYRDPEARVAAHLIDFSEGDHGVELTRLSTDLALRPGELEELSQRLARAGLVRVEAGHMQVTDRAGLDQYLSYLKLRERFGGV